MKKTNVISWIYLNMHNIHDSTITELLGKGIKLTVVVQNFY